MASADLVDPESEIREDFVPLRGWQAVPLKDLLQVVEPLVGHIVPEIREFALDSLEFATSFLRRHGGVDPNGLSLQQIAALNLYTKENLGQPGLSFHSVLNRALHSRDRSAVVPFLPYLRLFLDAAGQMPNAGPCKLWRGLKQQPAGGEESFAIGSFFHWWGFSSATRNARVLANPRFFGSSGARTLFSLECINGIEISMYSDYPEEEVLLLPGARFQVEQTMPPEITSGVLQIVLKQVACRHDLLNFVAPNTTGVDQSQALIAPSPPVRTAANTESPSNLEAELEPEPQAEPQDAQQVDSDARLASKLQASFDAESAAAEMLLPAVQADPAAEGVEETESDDTECESDGSDDLTGPAQKQAETAELFDTPSNATSKLVISGFPPHAAEANGQYSYADMYDGRPRFTRDEIKRTGADGRRLDSPMIVDDHVESASRHLEYRPNISQWVIDDELNPTSETNFAFIDIPDGYFPRGSRAWTVHSPDARVAVPCGGQYTVTIQVLSAAEVRVAKQHVNAARSNSMGCCICRTPPKDIFSLESRVGLQALNANGILAKYCHENLPLNDAKGMRVVHVRGRRTIWLRMIRLDPPLTDAQVIELAALLPGTDVEAIYMQGNAVTDDGAVALAEALRQMPRFRRLKIGGRVGERVREALGHASDKVIVV